MLLGCLNPNPNPNPNPKLNPNPNPNPNPNSGEVLLGGRALESFSEAELRRALYLPYISLISPLYLPGEAELRRKLSCVPQAPHIFSGSLRDNLDPTGAQADRALAPRSPLDLPISPVYLP